ncbi:hypothetical protein [Sphingomonas aerophila]|uniref:Uncharacterized protein n=1 Tax=Sphingomonas aerophila TaxID=1344948 RepID=A0A7W9EUQ2_9SPHN|nr:hypothetical protein [Sphingomonas aerophila]MBB5715415.1 hypothetical protein [Sphingomonas aerophila]
MIKSMILAVAALVIAAPAAAETFYIPSTVATNVPACPKDTVVASKPDATISGEQLPRGQNSFATIDLKAGKVKVGRCTFRIRGFANAIGAPWGASLVGDDNDNVLMGIATDKGSASDGIRGNGGNDTLSALTPTALIWGGGGVDWYNVPADRKIKINGKTYTQAIVQDLASGETVTRR